MSSLRAELRFLPNQLTAARLALVPVLWVAAGAGRAELVGIGLALCFALDWGDGIAARRLRQESAFGSRFDSIADGLVMPSAIVWLLLLRPQALLDHWPATVAWLAITYASIAVGVVKFRRFANLHLRSARFACVAQYAFAVDALAAPPYEPVLFTAAALLGTAASIESLALQLALPTVDERLGSFIEAFRRDAGWL